MGQAQTLFMDSVGMLNNNNNHRYEQRRITSPQRRFRSRSVQQQQSRRRLDFNTNVDDRMSSGLQGKGKHHFQKNKNQKELFHLLANDKM